MLALVPQHPSLQGRKTAPSFWRRHSSFGCRLLCSGGPRKGGRMVQSGVYYCRWGPAGTTWGTTGASPTAVGRDYRNDKRNHGSVERLSNGVSDPVSRLLPSTTEARSALQTAELTVLFLFLPTMMILANMIFIVTTATTTGGLIYGENTCTIFEFPTAIKM